MEKYKDLVLDVSKETIRYSPSDYPLLAILKEKQFKNVNNKLNLGECGNTIITWFRDNENGEYERTENFLQIFRTDFPKLKDKKKKAIEHLKKIEQAFWYGEREKCETCGKLKHPTLKRNSSIDLPGVRITGGVIQFLSENKKFVRLNDNFSEKEFNELLQFGFAIGTNHKMLFADKKSFKYICKMFKGKFSNKKFGFFKKEDAKILVTKFGTANIIKSSVFKSRMLCLLDTETLNYRYLHNRDMRLHIFNGWRIPPDMDTSGCSKTELKKIKKVKYKHYYITECGLMIGNFNNHSLVLID